MEEQDTQVAADVEGALDAGTSQEAPASWERTATRVVYIMVVVAFAYMAWAFFEQRKFNRLMGDLFSTDETVSAAAAETLASSGGSYPYLTNALKWQDLPDERVRCATVILRRLDVREKEGGSFESDEDRRGYLRSGLNLEAVTAALEDECPEVRSKALEIITKVGLEQNYQRTRRSDMLGFEELLTKLAGEDVVSRETAASGLREAGVRALPYLVGVVFARDGRFLLQDVNVLKYEDAEFRIAGLGLLRTIVQDVLRGSNQRRIVTLLGRRRCRLLLAEMTRLTRESARKSIVDVLNVSGRMPADFFTEFESAYTSTTDPGVRRKLLEDSIRRLEALEKVRGELPGEIEKAGKLQDRTETGK